MTSAFRGSPQHPAGPFADGLHAHQKHCRCLEKCHQAVFNGLQLGGSLRRPRGFDSAKGQAVSDSLGPANLASPDRLGCFVDSLKSFAPPSSPCPPSASRRSSPPIPPCTASSCLACTRYCLSLLPTAAYYRPRNFLLSWQPYSLRRQCSSNLPVKGESLLRCMRSRGPRTSASALWKRKFGVLRCLCRRDLKELGRRSGNGTGAATSFSPPPMRFCYMHSFTTHQRSQLR